MTLRGRVENGSIVLADDTRLPEGAEVRVEVLEEGTLEDSENGQTPPPLSVYDKLKHVIGTVEGLPADLAANHDHYIHGAPKR